jgi:hypothetical protein
MVKWGIISTKGCRMRSFAVAVVLCLALFSMVHAQTYPGYGTGSNSRNHFVNPYQTNQGVSVPGHFQTNPNRTDLDNFGTRGNYNPYTGQTGTRWPRYR